MVRYTQSVVDKINARKIWIPVLGWTSAVPQKVTNPARAARAVTFAKFTLFSNAAMARVGACLSVVKKSVL